MINWLGVRLNRQERFRTAAGWPRRSASGCLRTRPDCNPGLDRGSARPSPAGSGARPAAAGHVGLLLEPGRVRRPVAARPVAARPVAARVAIKTVLRELVTSAKVGRRFERECELSQRISHPINWRQSCVMKDTWRLVNRTELYNLADDPGQQNDIAAQHPEIVAELQSLSWPAEKPSFSPAVAKPKAAQGRPKAGGKPNSGSSGVRLGFRFSWYYDGVLEGDEGDGSTCGRNAMPRLPRVQFGGAI